jgi:hypothetical protein
VKTRSPKEKLAKKSTWRGLGWLYPSESTLEAYSRSCNPDFVLQKFDLVNHFSVQPKKCQLVMVTARLVTVTKSQLRAMMKQRKSP